MGKIKGAPLFLPYNGRKGNTLALPLPKHRALDDIHLAPVIRRKIGVIFPPNNRGKPYAGLPLKNVRRF